MLTQIKRWLEPPHFEGDEEKTSQAQLMNTLTLYLALLLIFAATIFVPFFAHQKVVALAIILVLLVLDAYSRRLMFHGRIYLARTLMLCSIWGLFQGLALFAGGITSPVLFALFDTTIIMGVLFKSRIGNVFVVASILMGLGMAVLQANDFTLPAFFVFTPLTTWLWFGMALVFMTSTMNLIVRNLENALARAREQKAARQLAEQSLRESEEKYRGLVEGSPDAVAIYMDGKVVFANAASVQLLRAHSVDELVGRSVIELVHPDFRAFVTQRMIAARKEGKPLPLAEEKFIRFDGTAVDVEVKAIPVTFDRKPAVQIIVRDITERKRAEEALRQSEQTARRMAEQLRLVNQLGVTITAGLDFERLMQTIYEQCLRIGNTDTFYIALRDDATGTLSFPFSYREGERRAFASRNIGENPGLVGHIIEHRQTLYIPDRFNLPAGITPVNLPGTPSESIIGVPLILNDRVVGVLSMQSHSPNAYTPEQIQTLELLATPVAIAIQNSQLYEQVQQELIDRQRAELQREILYQVLRAVSSQLDLDRVVSSAAEIIVQLTGYPHVCIALADENSTHWIVRGAAGSLAAELGATYPIHQGVIGRAFETGQTQWVRDILDDPHYVRDVSAADAPALRSEIVEPLRRGDHLLGALNIESDRVDAFNDADAKMIQSLAGIISLALENARLYNAAQQEITERKRTEEALRESEARYQMIFDNSGTANSIFDTECRLVLQNKMARDLGAKLGAVQGKTAREIFGEQGLTVTERMRRVMALGISEVFETAFNPPGGQKWFRSAYHPIFDEHHILVGLQVISQDITERKRTEEALKKSETWFRSLFENASDGIFYLSTNNDLAEVNQAFARMHGYSVEEMQSMNLKELDAPETARQFPERMRRTMAGEVFTFEVEHYHKDGHTFPLEVTTSVITMGHEKYVLAFHRDITERKRAEEALLKFKLGIERSADAIFMTDPQGTIVYANPSFEKIYGYTPSEAVGHTPQILKSGVVPSEQYQQFWATLLAKGIVAGEIINKTKDGRLITIEGSNNPILDAAGNIIGFLGMHRDITARKRAEEQLSTIMKAVESTRDAVGISDAQGRHFFQNRALSDLFGYATAEELQAAGGGPSVVKDPAVAREMFEKIKSSKSWAGELDMVTKSGRVFPAYERADAILDNEGNLVGLVGVITDITERKQRENELRVIATLSTALRTAPTRAEMLPVIVEQMVALLNCATVSIEIIEPLTGDAVTEAAYGAWAALIGTHQKSGTGINAIISQTRQPYHTNDLSHDPNLAYPEWTHTDIRGGIGAPLIAQGHVIGFLWMGRRTDIAESEVRLLMAVADIAANAIYRTTLHERTQQDAAALALAYDSTLEGWAHALELRDQETEGHTRRVVQITVDLARAMGIAEDELEHVRRGALLHDIGKMGVPDSVLLKPGTLNEREWEIMRRHPEYAYQLLVPIEYLNPVLDIPYCHHERWDGAGYPRGLQGEAIPLAARIFAIVDVWDALTTDRPYRQAWSAEQTLKHIQEGAGKHFDPRVVEAFLKIV